MTALEEAFLAIVCDTGSPVAECQCGKIHYNAEGEFMDEGELDRLLAKHEVSPEAFMAHQGAPSYGQFNGETLVWECACGRARAFAQLLWHNRHTVTQFLRTVATSQAEDAAAILDALPLISNRRKSYESNHYTRHSTHLRLRPDDHSDLHASPGHPGPKAQCRKPGRLRHPLER